MIDLEKLKNVKRLITHANCPDGIASAMIIRDALPDVEVLFVKHGTEQHKNLPRDHGTLFCDFAPASAWADGSGSWIQEWLDAGALVLDHHPTQRDVTMKFVEAGLGAYGENDRGECGAWLAYEHVWLPLVVARPSWSENDREWKELVETVGDFAKLAGIRDTWKKNDPLWQDACVQAEELMFWGDRRPLTGEWGHLSVLENPRLGSILFEKKLESARTAISESHVFQTPKGTRVLMFQGVSATSDAAEICEKEWDPRARSREPNIVAGFHYKVDGGKLNLGFSTRSHTGYDVGAFCKARGGGGHHAAAGFGVEQSVEVGANPYAVFRELLEEWEEGQ